MRGAVSDGRPYRDAHKCVTLLRRDSADVTSAIPPTRSVDLTSLPIARIVLILKAELFLRTTGGDASTFFVRRSAFSGPHYSSNLNVGRLTDLF